MSNDFVLNGQAHGNVAQRLLNCDFDPLALRPWKGNDGRDYITVNTGRRDSDGSIIYESRLIGNASATLRKEEWKQFDDVIARVAKPRLAIVDALRGRGLNYNIPNGMGKTVLETQRMSDITPAEVAMDPVKRSESDRPEFDLTHLPLPVTFKDFDFSARQLAVSRQAGGSPLDTTTAELAARRVAEEIEMFFVGLRTFRYGGGEVYGLTNFPGRQTQVLTNPSAGGWEGKTLVSEILAMVAKSQNNYHYGPWGLFVSPAWAEFLDADYSETKGDNTLRTRILQTQGIEFIQQLDYMSGFHIVLVQLTSDVIRVVSGMNVTTLQWETHGGLMLHFKVMAIIVPQIRADLNGNNGIVHGTAPE